LGSNNERKYLPAEQYDFKGSDQNDQIPLQLMTPDEKVMELQHIVEQQRIENMRIQEYLEQVGSQEISQGNMNIMEQELFQKNEEVLSLKQQHEQFSQEKQAYFLISNDIQGLTISAIQDLNSQNKDPHKNAQTL